MNRLIDDLLSLSRIEITEHQPPQGRIDFAQLVPRALAGFEQRIADRRVRLDLTLRDLPLIPGDADQMAQVLANLLDNALKYGREQGCITLSVIEARGFALAQPPRTCPHRRRRRSRHFARAYPAPDRAFLSC